MANDNFFSDRDARLIRKMLTGGVALGGAAGIGASLANYIKTLNSERATTADDDDTLYVTLPPSASKTASIGGGVALAAGGLGTLASYAAVRKLYQKFKKQQLQERLDQAQLGYVDALDGVGADEQEKAAADGKSMGVMELLTSMPWFAPMVLGLGSGVVTHKLLDDAYPTNKSDKSKNLKPKRIVIRQRGEKTEDEGNEKLASFDLDYNLDDGAELILHTITSNEKSASLSELPDVVYALASGRHAEMSSAFENGAEFGLTVVKGASENKVSPVARELAHILAIKSASIGPSIRLLAAAEFVDNFPGLVKAAAELPEHIKEALAGLACTYGAMLRKEASADILKALDIRNSVEDDQELEVEELRVPDLLEKAIAASNDMDQPIDAGGEVTDEQDTGLSLEKDTEESGNRVDNSDTIENTDPIDGLLAGETPAEATEESQALT